MRQKYQKAEEISCTPFAFFKIKIRISRKSLVKWVTRPYFHFRLSYARDVTKRTNTTEDYIQEKNS